GGAVGDMRRDYELAERIGSRTAWEVFLGTHKSGFYADLAQAQLTKLAKAEGAMAPESSVLHLYDPAEQDQKYKVASPEPVRPPPSTRPNSSETRGLDKVKNSADRAELRDFIARYPASPLALMAQSRAEQLEKAAQERAEKARAEREAAKKREDEERQAKAAEAARQKADR